MHDQADHIFIGEVNQHLGIAHKVCRIYVHDEDERKDLLQEMMYQLWKSYPKFDKRSKFSTWMYSVCLNTALTFKCRSGKLGTESISLMHHEIADRSQLDDRETMNVLFEAISLLSPLNKAIVLLYLESMSYEEIAAITGLTKSNVSVKLVRIKKELEKILKEKN